MNKSFITEPLGLFGWKHLEPVILASLVTELPMLLIGKHGCAKSFILERLAESLNLEYRFYNASLINYDDLVGIPIPVNNNTTLSYISNSCSIWDAEVVFIDEINRTKPELQNKLFPIIYDKRIQGQNLTHLKHRWAAMNPPTNEDDEDSDFNYVGAMQLDPALADRFPFIIEVPSWNELSKSEREKMLLDQYKGRHEFSINIEDLIEKTKQKLDIFKKEENEEITKYVITLMDLLTNSFGYISPRRATMLQETILAIYAAESVLNENNKDEKIIFQDIAYLHIQNTLPFVVNKKIDKTLLLSICNEALKIAKLDEGIEKKILLISNPLEQMKFAIKNASTIDIDILCDVIPNALSQIENPKRRVVALASYLTFRKNRHIPAAIMESLVNEIRPVFEAKKYESLENLNTRQIADRVDQVLAQEDKKSSYYKYLSNTLKSFLPHGYRDSDQVRELYVFFKDFWTDIEL